MTAQGNDARTSERGAGRRRRRIGTLYLATVLGILLGGTLPSEAALAQDLDLAAVDRAVERIMADVGIPGVALAVVRSDRVLHLRGYGVRELGAEAPVGPATLFATGSVTKAFTATLVAMLTEQDRLGWDDRVVDRLPGFELADPLTTGSITLRDLLAHRSGLPAANLMWLFTPQPPDTLVRRLRALEPVAGFRASFTYQNLLYVTAGKILERTAGRPWDRLLEDRLLGPLGMEDTNASVTSLAGHADVATPHVRTDGGTVPVPFRTLDHVAPAGAINSSARDLARWLRFLLAGGSTPDGRRLLQPGTLRETWTPQIVVPDDPVTTAFHPAARMQAYGMGWFLSDFHGRTLVAHGGGIDGMSALVAWIPEEDIGVAVLTNLQTPAPAWTYGIAYAVLDRALDVPTTPWEAPYRELEALLAGPTAAAPPERTVPTRPSHALGAYTGPYVSPTLGELRVERGGEGTLVLRYGSLVGTLEHWHFDTFRVTWQDPAWQAMAGPGWVTFQADRSGAVQGLTLEALPGQDEHLVRRDPDGRAGG